MRMDKYRDLLNASESDGPITVIEGGGFRLPLWCCVRCRDPVRLEGKDGGPELLYDADHQHESDDDWQDDAAVERGDLRGT